MKSYKMIRDRLEELDMSQVEFSKIIGKSQSHISKIVNGNIVPNPDLANSISHVLSLGSMYVDSVFFERQQRKLQVARRHIFGPEEWIA